MMAITTSNSINVNPSRRHFIKSAFKFQPTKTF
jgi:hypothetical protein